MVQVQLKVVIFSRGAGAQRYGLGKDAKLMELTMREFNSLGKYRVIVIHKDPYKYIDAEHADIHIYLEVPCRAAFPWAKANIVVPNPEWWLKDEWAWVKDEPSTTFFHKTKHSRDLFSTGEYVGWRYITDSFTKAETETKEKKDQFLYIVGGSKHKLAAANKVVDGWLPEYSKLIIVSQVKGIEKPNVVWRTGYLPAEELRLLQVESRYHVVASLAEGYGFTMTEAMAAGAKILWTDIPVYKEIWAGLLGSNGCIRTVPDTSALLEGASIMADRASLIVDNGLTVAMNTIDKQQPEKAMGYITNLNRQFRELFTKAFSSVVSRLSKDVLKFAVPSSMPFLGVVTLVKNRPEWFINAVRNIELTDYPKDKLVWVIVDDGDKRVDLFIDRTKQRLPDVKIVYVSLPRPIHIGEKRNIGVQRAIDACPAITELAFMDDDDHYPAGSLTKRVCWLKSFKKPVVYCSTLPMYDTTRYISAMNVPPLDLAPRKRVSEATLCFTRAFWEEKGFPNKVSVAEGEEFLLGRELQSMEIIPDGIIVSFLHGKNFTSRRVPESTVPNGCHYGFSDEYFMLISQLGNAGV